MARSGSSAASRRAQRGAALLALLAVAMMVFAYVLTSGLSAASLFGSVDVDHNAKVLAKAKHALIGYMALQAAKSGEDNPGHLPCPEAPANYGTANEGIEAPFCAAQAIGRLPWRTLGLEKLVDAAGEPLWYAVSPGWHRPSSTATLSINSDVVGQLSVSGISGNAVALIIAPGSVQVTQACGGAAARAQQRPTSGTADLRDYLECENANTPADTAFVASRAGQTFNDQVLAVLPGDVLPALEAAIAERMQREIAPAMRAAAYTSASYSGIPSGAPLYPSPVPFSDPSASSYQITAFNTSSPYNTNPPYPSTDNPQGLLPFNQIGSACSAPPPCAPLPISHPVTMRSTASGYIESSSCSTNASEAICEGVYHEDSSSPWNNVRLEMAVTFNKVAMGFRALAANPLSHVLVEARDDGSTGSWQTPAPTLMDVRMNDGLSSLPDGTTPPRGSVTIRFRATMPNIDAEGWGTVADFRMRINRAVFDDHALLKSTDPTVGWFVRNQWYRNTYYAVAKQNTAQQLPSLGCDNTNCLRFNEGLSCGGGAAWCNIRVLLVLSGASLTNQVRPNGSITDYFEYTNADNGSFYEQHGIRRPTNIAVSNGPWNDRVVIVDWLNWQTTSLQLTSPNNHPQVVANTTTSAVRIHYLPLP